MMRHMVEYLVITGMSGAGRSHAGATMEDLGWYVIDNLPSPLIGRVAGLAGDGNASGNASGNGVGIEGERIALVMGRSAGQLDELRAAIDQLRHSAKRVTVLYLEASSSVLVRRFEGTRRRHPIPGDSVTASIEAERALLRPIRESADLVIDTTELTVHQLRQQLIDRFADDDTETMQVSVLSFGFKHGVPLDVDDVFDCRFLPNPHWIDELRPLTGLDQPVWDYVMAQPDTGQFLDKLDDLLGLLLPAYVKEGKSYLTIAVGCTGGRHRSVVLARELGSRIAARGFDPLVHHRDISR